MPQSPSPPTQTALYMDRAFYNSQRALGHGAAAVQVGRKNSGNQDNHISTALQVCEYGYDGAKQTCDRISEYL